MGKWLWWSTYIHKCDVYVKTQKRLRYLGLFQKSNYVCKHWRGNSKWEIKAPLLWCSVVLPPTKQHLHQSAYSGSVQAPWTKQQNKCAYICKCHLTLRKPLPGFSALCLAPEALWFPLLKLLFALRTVWSLKGTTEQHVALAFLAGAWSSAVGGFSPVWL